MTLTEGTGNGLDMARTLAIPIRELRESERPLLLKHLTALGMDDRYLRFGGPLSDAAIENYVNGIDFQTQTVYGIFDEDLALAAAGHFAPLPGVSDPRGGSGSVAEFGLSVAQSARGRGLGTALFVRAAIHARNLGIEVLFMHCLTQNTAMMRIARKAGMDITLSSGEADAYITLPPGDTASVMREAVQEQIALFDFAFKQQMARARRLRQAFAAIGA